MCVGHSRGVQGGSVSTHKTSRAGGRHEHPAGGTRVRPVAENDPEDAAVFIAARLRTEKTGRTPEAGSVAGSHRSDSVGRSIAAEKTTAHSEADLGPAK